MSLAVVTTGGTFDKVYFDAKSRYEVGEPMVPRLLEDARVSVDWRVVEFSRKDSLELTETDRAALRRCIAELPERRVVVIHGTDTMTETAMALAGLAQRTVVLTGALQPARMRDSDAAFNLGAATALALTLPEGVYVSMQGRVFAAGTVRKNPATGQFEPLPGRPR
jgi:L-asparaginase